MTGSAQSSNTFSTVTGLVREIRPWQWYKQGVMFLGILFSKNILNPEALASLLIGVVAFTAVTSATYILNDIFDLEADRNHPEKRHRPIASGQVSVRTAAAFAAVLAVFGLSSGFSLGILFLSILLVYLVQNILYSLVLKRVVFVDVLVVAIGFVIRAIAGVVAIDVFLSPWLIVSTFLLALVLAIGKRHDELEGASSPAQSRQVLHTYSRSNLDQLLVMTMSALLMAYSLYTFSRADFAMMVTIPFAFFGCFRYHYLLHNSDVAGNPEYILTDRPSVANFILWSVLTTLILYDVPRQVTGWLL